MASYFLLWGVSALFFTHSSAFAEEIEATLTPVPTSISGSFKPFVLAVDGKKMVNTSQPIVSLRLDDSAIIPRTEGKDAKTHPFFVQTGLDTFELISHSETKNEKTWTFVLPSLTMESVNSSEIILLTKGDVSSLSVDGKKLTLNGDRAVWEVPTSKAGFEKTRVVELGAGKEKPGRLYNLRLKTKVVAVEVPRKPTSLGERTVGLSLKAFRLSQLSVFQKSGGNSFSALASWTPAWFFTPSLCVGVNLAVSYLKAATTVKVFPVASYEFLVGYAPGSFAVEAGGGMQTWFGFGGTKPVGSLHLSKLLEKRLFGVVDRVFVAYSHFLSTPESSHEVRFGFGVRL